VSPAWWSTLESLPRVHAVARPTPLEPAPRLSAELGIDVWLKRDDLTGRGLGGNKVRTVEYLLGDLLAHGHDTLVTGAGTQSNWAMLAALTATTAGIEPHLVYYGSPTQARGNHLLAQLAGAHVRWTGELDRSSVDPMLEKVAVELSDAGRSPCVVPRGGATPRGCLGYVRGAVELAGQLTELALDPAAIWLPTGSCGTQAGLLAGLTVLGAHTRVVGVATSRSPEESTRRVRELAAGTLDLLGSSQAAAEPKVLGGFLGEAYGVPSAEGRRAAALVARTEGVFLDPVFGAKAMAALVHHARRRRVDGPVVFLVTGGAPTMFTAGAERP
jgi:D-cysteine desulfhydrase